MLQTIAIKILTGSAPVADGCYTLRETYSAMRDASGRVQSSMMDDLLETLSGVFSITEKEARKVIHYVDVFVENLASVEEWDDALTA